MSSLLHHRGLPQQQTRKRSRLLVTTAALAIVAGIGGFVAAQQQNVHPLIDSNMAPGVIGRKLLRSGQIKSSTYQPIRIVTPNSAVISSSSGNVFNEETYRPVLGLLVGRAYRFKVSYVTETEEHVVYPTIELIDKLDPPAGQEGKFPVPIELTAEEIKLAAAGNMVTRVIYVEDPKMSLPSIYRQGKAQPYFETDPGTDPLAVADTLGRPVAILRIGSRAPDSRGPTSAFMFHSPPLHRYGNPASEFAFEDSADLTPPVARRDIERTSYAPIRAARVESRAPVVEYRAPASGARPMMTMPVRNIGSKRQNAKRSTWKR